MGLADDLKEFAKTTHAGSWTRRDGTKVPDADDVQLGKHAVDLDAVVLYADLAESTDLVKGHKDWFAAEVYKNYLYCAAKVIRKNSGAITSYDGDRVMAVFIGGSKNTNAARTGLQIQWAVRNIINPAIEAAYPKVKYRVEQKVGIAASKLMAARTGIRGSNDLVWVGNAANIAAKLAAFDSTYSTYIESGVYSRLKEELKVNGTPARNMWTDLGVQPGFGKIYGSTWYWPFK